MDKSGSKIFLVIIIIALLLGAAVLIFKPDYRTDQILESNRNYYPDYKVVE